MPAQMEARRFAPQMPYRPYLIGLLNAKFYNVLNLNFQKGARFKWPIQQPPHQAIAANSAKNLKRNACKAPTNLPRVKKKKTGVRGHAF
jgi:hypothetical protein